MKFAKLTNCSRRESAHSLPEAIIAVLVLGTMLVSLYAGFSSGFSIVQSTREDLRATQILLQRLETIRLYTWSQLNDTTNYLQPAFVEYFQPPTENEPAQGPLYHGEIFTNEPAAIPVSAPYRANLLEVTVKVVWTNHSGAIRSRQMKTHVARYGLQNYLLP